MNETIPPGLHEWARERGLAEHRFVQIRIPTAGDPESDVIEINAEKFNFVLEESGLRYYVRDCQSAELTSVCYWLLISRRLLHAQLVTARDFFKKDG